MAPDIITSIKNGISLVLIQVYTTEITYVLDMGIISLISPLMFITFYRFRQENFTGYVFIRMIFKICMCIGIMLYPERFSVIDRYFDANISLNNEGLFVVMAVFGVSTNIRKERNRNG